MSRFSTYRAYRNHPKVIHPQELIMVPFRRRLIALIDNTIYMPYSITLMRQDEYSVQLRRELQQ